MSVATEALKIYLILIVNDICLIYVNYAKQLQLFHLVFIYEKEVVFVPKKGKIVVKINLVTSPYKTGTPTAFRRWVVNMPAHTHTHTHTHTNKKDVKERKIKIEERY